MSVLLTLPNIDLDDNCFKMFKVLSILCIIELVFKRIQATKLNILSIHYQIYAMSMILQYLASRTFTLHIFLSKISHVIK